MLYNNCPPITSNCTHICNTISTWISRTLLAYDPFFTLIWYSSHICKKSIFTCEEKLSTLFLFSFVLSDKVLPSSWSGFISRFLLLSSEWFESLSCFLLNATLFFSLLIRSEFRTTSHSPVSTRRAFICSTSSCLRFLCNLQLKLLQFPKVSDEGKERELQFHGAKKLREQNGKTVAPRN